MRQKTKAAILAVLLIVAVAVIVFVDIPALSTLRDWADRAGAWFPLAYWVGYVLITQFPVPRTILTLSSGILFGPLVGVIIATTATAVAACISLTTVRYLIGDWVRPRLTHPVVEKINARLRTRGWAAVISLRMIAGIPFSVMNYTAAMTEIRVATFTVATFIGAAPGTIATVFFGDTLTGNTNPAIIAITVALALLGIIGLAVDARRPVKSAG